MARSCVGDASSFVCSAARTFTAVAVRRCEMALIVVHVWKGQRAFSLAAFERGGASTEVMVVVLARPMGQRFLDLRVTSGGRVPPRDLWRGDPAQRETDHVVESPRVETLVGHGSAEWDGGGGAGDSEMIVEREGREKEHMEREGGQCSTTSSISSLGSVRMMNTGRGGGHLG
ncbi:unnamed protein product [Lampetra fluviatilis]